MVNHIELRAMVDRFRGSDVLFKFLTKNGANITKEDVKYYNAIVLNSSKVIGGLPEVNGADAASRCNRYSEKNEPENIGQIKGGKIFKLNLSDGIYLFQKIKVVKCCIVLLGGFFKRTIPIRIEIASLHQAEVEEKHKEVGELCQILASY